MRKSELKLKMMTRKLNIEPCDLEACLFSFVTSQLGMLGWHIVVLPFLSLFVIAFHLFMIGRIEV